MVSIQPESHNSTLSAELNLGYNIRVTIIGFIFSLYFLYWKYFIQIRGVNLVQNYFSINNIWVSDSSLLNINVWIHIVLLKTFIPDANIIWLIRKLGYLKIRIVSNRACVLLNLALSILFGKTPMECFNQKEFKII